MTFQKKKKAPPGVEKKSGKTFVVSVRLDEEQHKAALEKMPKIRQKIIRLLAMRSAKR